MTEVRIGGPNAPYRDEAMSKELGPLPEPMYPKGSGCGDYLPCEMRAYAAQEVAKERERCARLCDAKFVQHSATGFPREASTARALASLIRA